MLRSLTVSTRVLTPGCAALQERSTPLATAPATVTTKAATAKRFRLIGAITVDGENLPNNVEDFLRGSLLKKLFRLEFFSSNVSRVAVNVGLYRFMYAFRRVYGFRCHGDPAGVAGNRAQVRSRGDSTQGGALRRDQ